MNRLRLFAPLLAAVCLSAAAAGQERERQDRPPEDPCQSAGQRYRAAEETLRKAKEAGSAGNVIERRMKELDRTRRAYCDCASRAREKSEAPLPAELEELCNAKATLPTQATNGDKTTSAPAGTPTPQPSADACAREASGYEKTWMRYSENTGNKSLQTQLNSAKGRLCGCLVKNYAYDGVLPQSLRGFCEDRTILTPPYFPSRGETPRPELAARPAGAP